MVKRFSWLTPNDIPSAVLYRRIAIPFDLDIMDAVNGALSELSKPENWELFGTVTPDEIAYAMQTMFWNWHNSGGAKLIGAILPYATASAPENTLACDGATYLRTAYPELYLLLDAAFIVDADSFTVPDLRGRVPIGNGQGSGLTLRAVGDTGGAETHMLTTSEMPAHTHAESTAVASLAEAPVVPIPAATPGIGITGSAGGNGAHNNMPPFNTLRYCIVAR